ncbi:MAG: hypothetical protein VKK62_05425 [Synechococcaceae cyanobacterium]|nr:hypothetical protein [Synechococcaceae cyanobacterium]
MAVAAVLSESAGLAQNAPWEVHFDPQAPRVSVMEEHTGVRVVQVPVRVYPPMPLTAPISGTFSTTQCRTFCSRPQERAVGGTSCAPGIDFIWIQNRPFSLPVGFTGGFGFDVEICGDRISEFTHKTFEVVIKNTQRCGGGTGFGCITPVTIIDDDGAPALISPQPSPQTATPVPVHPPSLIQPPQPGCRKLSSGMIECSQPSPGLPQGPPR